MAVALEIVETGRDYQSLTTEFGAAIAYIEQVGIVHVGDKILLNRTAQTLDLGTGGYDFVIAVLSGPDSELLPGDEHIMKLRYTPSQRAVSALESDLENAHLWDRNLDRAPVAVCQLHSQIAHCAAAAVAEGKRVVYIMTDTACLMASYSRLLTRLKSSEIITACITCGQASQGDYETVTFHSALLAAKHLLQADVIVVAQGPGNAGTGTRYGFGGIEQASLLDTVAALGGRPIAAARVSCADSRERHLGISHHTTTTMQLVRSRCTIPLPEGMISEVFQARHTVVYVGDLYKSRDLLRSRNVEVTSMGRSYAQDPVFFDAASAAGRYASTCEGK